VQIIRPPIYFFKAKNTKCYLKSEAKFKRFMKNFILEDFLIVLNEKLSKIKLDSVNINADVSNIQIFLSLFWISMPHYVVFHEEKNG